MPHVPAVTDGMIVLSWGKMSQQIPLFYWRKRLSESLGLQNGDLRQRLFLQVMGISGNTIPHRVLWLPPCL